MAFFSTTLNASEQKHFAIEKKAYAIVEALQKWRHYLSGCTSYWSEINSIHVLFKANLVKFEMIKQSINPKGINIMADPLPRAYYSTVDFAI